jgi:hypothetical protein
MVSYPAVKGMVKAFPGSPYEQQCRCCFQCLPPLLHCVILLSHTLRSTLSHQSMGERT